MKRANRNRRTSLNSAALVAALIAVPGAMAANVTWSGGGSPDGNWQNANNWGGTAPNAGDALYFDGSSQLLATNNFAGGTVFYSLAFNPTASPFTLAGNYLRLPASGEDNLGNVGGGGITNLSSGAEVVSLPLTLAAGNHVVNTASGSGALTLAGGFTNNPGATVQFYRNGGGISPGLANNAAGVIGGWALYTTGSGSLINNNQNGGASVNWATMDGFGNLTNLGTYTSLSGNAAKIVSSATSNVKITSGGTAGHDDTMNAAGTTTINTLYYSGTSFSGSTYLDIPSGDILRLGAQGGIMANLNHYLRIGNNAGGTVTAGGAASTPGQLSIYNVSAYANGQIEFWCPITDNGSSAYPVSVTTYGSCEFDIANAFSGGLYINAGEFYQNGGGNVLGYGPVTVNSGGRADFGGQNGLTVTNSFAIAGYGFFPGNNPGAIKGTYNGKFTGPFALLGNASIDPNAGGSPNTCTFAGPFAGTGSLTIAGPSSSYVAGTATFGGIQSYTGDLVVDASANNNGGAGFKISSGSNNIMQMGGNVSLIGGSSGVAAFDLNGTAQIINGLNDAGGNAANAMVKSSAAGGVLTVGNNNTTSTFDGILANGGGTLALTKTGSGVLTLTGANTYTGNTIISNGTLALSGSLAGTAHIYVSSGATFDVLSLGTITLGSGQTLAGSGLVNGSVYTSGGSAIGPVISGIQINGSLTLNSGSTCSFNLAATTNNPANDLIIVSNSLSLAGGTIQINAATLQLGRFKLIEYVGAESGSAAANLVLSYVPSGVTVALDDSIAGEIDLLVTAGVPETLTWAGDGTQNIWDVGSSSDWNTNGAGSFVFTNGALAVFNDRGSKSPAVNLPATVQPLSLLVSNNTGTYTFSGGGSIAGGTALIKTGAGALVLNETGGDSFGGGILVQGGSLDLADAGVSISGGITVTNSSLTLAASGTIAGNLTAQNAATVLLDQSATITGNLTISNSAIVQLGANDANGTLPAGNVNNNGTLVFNRTDDLTVANAIYGTGTLVKTNANALTLATDNSSWTGAAIVQQGTLKVGAINAIGNGSTPITVNSGATLDFNGVANNLLSVTAAGAGVGGNGAIVDNGADVYPVVTNITLAGDIVIGGTGRWDLRSLGGTTGNPAAAALSTGGQPYNLIKTGNNFIGIVAAAVDTNLANIDLQSGTLDIEGNTTGLGNPTNTFTVENGATLFFYQPTNRLNKMFVMQDGSTFDNNSGATAVIGPVLLNTNASGGPGNITFNCGGSSLAFSNVISGPGNLLKAGGGSYLFLAGTNTYTGSTVVTAGWLALAGNGSIAGSSNIVLNYTRIDATFRTDKTFTLTGGQTLSGTNSALQGFLVTSPGSTLLPGGNGYVDTLTVSSNATLAGNLIMDLDEANATNDVLAVGAGRSITFGGTLSLSNLTATLAAGNSFKLFNATAYSGAFTNITPATPGDGLVWDTGSLTNNGVLNVISAVKPTPTITGISLSGTTLTITATNGAAAGQYVLLGTTNLALPLADWTPILTNAFDAGGNLNLSTNIISPGSPREFYILLQ